MGALLREFKLSCQVLLVFVGMVLAVFGWSNSSVAGTPLAIVGSTCAIFALWGALTGGKSVWPYRLNIIFFSLYITVAFLTVVQPDQALDGRLVVGIIGLFLILAMSFFASIEFPEETRTDNEPKVPGGDL